MAGIIASQIAVQSNCCLMSESEAILAAQNGGAAAFERLYELHSRRVYALCLRMVANPVEAEDLTQEAFLQLFRKIHTFRGESGFSTWLHRLTVNIVLMRFRKRKRAELSIDEARETAEENPRMAFDPGADDLCLSGLIDRINLSRAVEQLPLGYKQMFVLHDVQGYEHNEIARILGCSVGNSKSQLHKARLRLRQLLREDARNRARRRREEQIQKAAGTQNTGGSQHEARAPIRGSSSAPRRWCRGLKLEHARG